MTDDDAGGRGGKNGDFWMTSFVNDPSSLFPVSSVGSIDGQWVDNDAIKNRCIHYSV